jgi:hypothetical protein
MLLHIPLHHYYSTGFAVGILPFADYEDSGQGVTADTVNTSNKYNITMAQVLGMFIFDIIFYSFLAWYAGQVVKSEWGTSKPWYFLVTKVHTYTFHIFHMTLRKVYRRYSMLDVMQYAEILSCAMYT